MEIEGVNHKMPYITHPGVDW